MNKEIISLYSKTSSHGNRETVPGQFYEFCYMSNGLQPKCCRVALVENVSVPPESEIIVLGKPLDKLDRSRVRLIEPTLKFVKKTGLMVAKVLVDPKNGNRPLRLANMSKEPITV